LLTHATWNGAYKGEPFVARAGLSVETGDATMQSIPQHALQEATSEWCKASNAADDGKGIPTINWRSAD
jgi:hypothetical protein